MTQSDQPVREILTPCFTRGAFPDIRVAATGNLGLFLNRPGAMISLNLSCDTRSNWTNHLTKTSLTAAESAASIKIAEHLAAPNTGMIKPAGLTQHHAPMALNKK